MKIKSLKEQIKEMSYSEFTMWLNENWDLWQPFVPYDDWSVVRIQNHPRNGGEQESFYIYYAHPVEGETDDIFEVRELARLLWDTSVAEISDKVLFGLFPEADIGGETDQLVDVSTAAYIWFIDVDKKV